MSTRFPVILPAYNEASAIERAILETAASFDALAAPYEIIVVDDGSTDGTAALAEAMRARFPTVRVARHATNAGKGAAVRTGAQAAEGEVVLFLDCDLSTHPDTFRSFIPLLTTHDLVIGSRRVKGAVIPEPQPLWRSLLGRAFNAFIRIYLRLPYHDTQCGFKAVKRSALPILKTITSDGWAFDVELLARAREAGLTVVECPITWNNRRESRVRLGSAWSILNELRQIKHAVKSDR